ncbi:hypothetical protein [Halobacteriaceae bacterium SHR40]|uniref:hypothetical protein n=1 Tax=Halovenus amylolytica TaxID=2500550 RepID=UPI000FE30800
MVLKTKQLETIYEDSSITSPEQRERAFGTSRHVRLYGQNTTDRLSDAEFMISVRTFGKELLETTVQKYWLEVGEQFLEREFEDIYHCRKELAV